MTNDDATGITPFVDPDDLKYYFEQIHEQTSKYPDQA